MAIRLSYSLNRPTGHNMEGANHGFTTTEEQHHQSCTSYRERGREGWHDYRPDHPQRQVCGRIVPPR